MVAVLMSLLPISVMLTGVQGTEITWEIAVLVTVYSALW